MYFMIGGHFEILSKLLVDIVGFCGGFSQLSSHIYLLKNHINPLELILFGFFLLQIH